MMSAKPNQTKIVLSANVFLQSDSLGKRKKQKVFYWKYVNFD